MTLSDLSVRRPVFAAVISLLLMAFGVLAFRDLPLREYPDLDPPVVSVVTRYVGASAEIIETRITQVIEDQISGIEGIKSITSSSRDESSQIQIEFTLDRAIDEAANDVRDRVARVAELLPDDAETPEVAKTDTDARPALYMSLASDTRTPMELTDYAERHVIDRFSVIPGVAQVAVTGSGRPSMQIRLDRLALAARGLTVLDVEAALRRQNIELPAGRLESRQREFQLRLARDYVDPDDFRALVVGQGADGALVRLGEVATVMLAPRDSRSLFRANQKNTVGIAVFKQSRANALAVLETVKREIVRMDSQLPGDMELIASSDDSQFIRDAIDAVYETLVITTVLVSVVIFLFLGSVRAMLIPVLTIPVCLVASFMALAAFDHSVNLITLLALVLAIGLVVDDAVVVLENVHRRIEGGEAPLLAAYNGTRQVAFAVLATTAVLVAAFVPILFLDDNVGRIFAELAVTVSAAVIFSSVLALSLTPMLCSKLLRRDPPGGLAARLDHAFDRLSAFYAASLRAALRVPLLVVAAWLAIVGGAAALLAVVPSEYTPQEDQGLFFARVQAAEGTSFANMLQHVERLEQPLVPLLESGEVARVLVRMPGFGSSAPSSAGLVVTLAPAAGRTRSTQQVLDELLAHWQAEPGVRVFTFLRSGLSRSGGGPPVQFVLQGSDYAELARWRDLMLERMRSDGRFVRIDADLKETQPQMRVRVDRDRAAALGVSVEDVGRTLQTMLSERQVTTFVSDGEEYDVVLRAPDAQRADPSDLANLHVRSATSGQLVSLANLVRIDDGSGAQSLNRYNRMRAVTISADLAPGFALGEAIAVLRAQAGAVLPADARTDLRGESLEYAESAGGLWFTFGIAMLIVYLVLAAQFESFVHPVVILTAVPLAIAGGVAGLLVAGMTLNIYSQIGLVMLLGIAAKNGVLIVEFINQMRDAGMAFGDAVIEGARLRLRPVLMTTLATAMGAVPLMLASGAGSQSRATLGVVVFAGAMFATFVTLLVVPAFYTLLARRTGSPNAVARELERLGAT